MHSYALDELSFPDSLYVPRARADLCALADQSAPGEPYVPADQIGLCLASQVLQQDQVAFVFDPHAFVRCDSRTGRCRPCDEVPILTIHLSR